MSYVPQGPVDVSVSIFLWNVLAPPPLLFSFKLVMVKASFCCYYQAGLMVSYLALQVLINRVVSSIISVWEIQSRAIFLEWILANALRGSSHNKGYILSIYKVHSGIWYYWSNEIANHTGEMKARLWKVHHELGVKNVRNIHSYHLFWWQDKKYKM